MTECPYKNLRRGLAAVFALAGVQLMAAGGQAADYDVGSIHIAQPWARATPKGASNGAGYMTITNNGTAPDRVTCASSDASAQCQVHTMSMEGGVMKMRELKDGLEIPAHGSVKLAPNGYHLMFTGLKRPLVKGESLKATLTFEHAGAVAVDFAVQGVGAAGPGGAMKGDDMKGMKM